MADIANTVRFEDPLGTPTVIKGTEYMDALSKLGYNVDNMTSPLPVMADIAKAGSSMLDSVYQQNMNWQKSQADLAYSKAQTDKLQSDTDYNNAALQYRVKQLDLDNQLKQNDLTLSTRTLEGAIAAENAKNANAPILDQQSITKGQQEEDLNKIKLDNLTKGQALQQKAQDEYAQAKNEFPDLTASDQDYHQKWADSVTKYPEAWADPTYGTMLKNEHAARDAARTNNQTIIQRNNDLADIKAGIAAGTLTLQPNQTPEGLASNHVDAIKAVARSRAVGSLHDVQTLLDKIPRDPQAVALMDPAVRAQATYLTNLRDRVQALFKDPQTADASMDSIMSGGQKDIFNTNGTLNAGLQGDIDALKIYYEKQVTAGFKPETTEVEVDIPDPTAPSGARKAVAKNVPLDRVGFAKQQLETNGTTTVPGVTVEPKKEAQPQQVSPEKQQARAAGSAALQQRMKADPAFRAQIIQLRDQAQKSGKASDWKKYYDAAGAGAIVRGMQSGGAVDPDAAQQAVQGGQDVVTASLLAGQQMAAQPPPANYQTGGDVTYAPPPLSLGSTDTVPAMLSPGEFVVNAPAAKAVGLPLLNQLNQTGQTTIQPPPEDQQDQQPDQQASRISNQARLGSIQMPPMPGMEMLKQYNQQQRQGTTQPAQGAARTAQGATQPAQSGTPAPSAISSTGQPLFLNPATGSYEPLQTTAPPTTRPMTPSPQEMIAQKGAPAAGGNWISGRGTEFGEVDNPVYGGYTEPGWNKGRWGDNISGWDTEGVALPNAPHGTVVEVRNPKTGVSTITTVKDRGPGRGTGAAIDLLGGTRAKLGFARNFAGPVEYRILGGPGTQGYQRGGFVGGGELSGGRRGGGGGGAGDEDIFGGGQPGQGGGWLPQQQQKRRRFHPRMPGQQGPDIPDEMQKKLAKLGHDYLSGLSGMIQQRPEFGPALLRHARNQLASNMGTGAEEETAGQYEGMPGGGGEQEDQGIDQGQQYSQAQYAMTAMGEQPGNA